MQRTKGCINAILMNFACVHQGGLARIKSNLASRVKKGKMAQQAADAVFARVKGTLDYNDFGSVDMVRKHSCPSHLFAVG